MEYVAVTVPGGWHTEQGWQRTAHLRPMRGSDELFVAESGAAQIPAVGVTALLTRCLDALGTVRPVSPDDVRALTVGDREALLLQLRRLMFGDRVSCVVICPQPSCGEKLDLDLSVDRLLTPAYPEARRYHDQTLVADGVAYRVRFRLPNGGDQEAAAALAAQDADAAALLVLQRCIERIEVDGEHAPLPAPPPAALVDAVAQAMAARDPQAELQLLLDCPVCGAAFTAPFDAARYFFQELSGQAGALYREIHHLALHYHWSERAILSFTGSKRRRYLDLLAETLGRGAGHG